MVPTAPRSATGLPIDFKAQAEQVRSIAIERLGRRVGMLDAALQTDLDEALRLHLALDHPVEQPPRSVARRYWGGGVCTAPTVTE